MNDKKFREDCKVFANDVIGFYSDWRKSLTEPEHWLDTMEDTSQLATAALLYIAANMPSSNEGAKKPCKFCSDDAKHDPTVFHYLYIDSKHKQLVDVCDGTVTRAAIKYCPMCGRKL